MRIIATAHCKECQKDVGSQTGETPDEDPVAVKRAEKALAADLRNQIAKEGNHPDHFVTIRVEGAGEA